MEDDIERRPAKASDHLHHALHVFERDTGFRTAPPEPVAVV